MKKNWLMSDWSFHNAPQPQPQDNQKILFHTCIKTEVILSDRVKLSNLLNKISTPYNLKVGNFHIKIYQFSGDYTYFNVPSGFLQGIPSGYFQHKKHKISLCRKYCMSKSREEKLMKNFQPSLLVKWLVSLWSKYQWEERRPFTASIFDYKKNNNNVLDFRFRLILNYQYHCNINQQYRGNFQCGNEHYYKPPAGGEGGDGGVGVGIPYISHKPYR